MIRRRVAICTAIEDRSPLKRVLPNWRALDFTVCGEPCDVVVIAATNDASPETVREFARGLKPYPVASVEFPDLVERVPDLDEQAKPWSMGREVVWSHKRAALRASVQRSAIDQEADWLLWLDSDNTLPETGFLCLLESLTGTTGRAAPKVVSGVYPERRAGDLLARRWGQHIGRGVPPLQLSPNRLIAAGYMGFGAVLMHRDVAAQPDLDFLQLYANYRALRRHLLEFYPDAPFPPYGEDPLWFLACETLFGVPLYIDTRVRADHWRDEWSYWRVCDGEDGLLTSELVCLDADGREAAVYQPGPKPPPGAPPVGEPHPPAEVAALQEAAG